MYKGEKEIYSLIRGKSPLRLEDISSATGLNSDTVRRALESLKDRGAVTISVSERASFAPTDELKAYLHSGFPEFHVLRKAFERKGISDLSPSEKAIGLNWAKQKGLVKIDGGSLLPALTPQEADHRLSAFQASVLAAVSGDPRHAETLQELQRRKLVQSAVSRDTTASYTGKQVSIEDGFDIRTGAGSAPICRNHPQTVLTNRIKEIFTELGFEEMEGGVVESSFWNFDSLFQPQDHPARELADTFYLDGQAELPSDSALVSRVKKAHEKGWKSAWSPDEARKKVLRTHTTALSSHYLSKLRKGDARKYFSVGKVFRNEATDFKHLAEFYQVEGIISWDGATFRDLLGILKEFYSKLGFKKVRFRPSYFPYTEPSLEIDVFFEPKQEWFELGGAGIFRPEVSEPLYGGYPVLAWGLSLERPLMMLMDLKDIRVFYKNDISWLREANPRM